MNILRDVLRKSLSVALVCTLLAPPAAMAKPLDAATVHDKIAKRGVGTWICVEERNGVALIGRITSIDADSFGMQLQNYPDITPVMYSDVTRIRLGISRGGMFAIIGATVGAAVVAGLVMHHEYESNKATLPTMPALPAMR